ncbi:hypothetical protein A3B64_05065 [candidate division WWE3 bacterium RIFCSPLOWO2_01_FULL_37_24]|uniref:Methyltransferase type 11 domain-containing protein n=1 Tax=candidate division WWE3 bacterium RIFCSPHIGHO2_02_FULL_38_14 TaxID=1802620 RepID=A0A1F4V9J1_UNCKA|nr:MAG: hypothetical protein A3D91_01365 [candidate division WWE3 bacterium RIFCSPHIGHO2_02_FULL_38_14]OGC54538.1 MAG: hypothetical protein A3B64_05065 [candidate division WWE3 bacterium RIFCSPLOWO2_01_FULL_37_24]
MSKEEFDKINKLENTHWWYVGTREISFEILEKYLPQKTGIKSLDVGCGTGGNMNKLLKYGIAEGIDVDPYAVELTRQNGFNCRVGDMHNLNLPEESYDLITFYDVINQTKPENILKVFKDVGAGLKCDGIFSFREPAMNIATGSHDKEVGILYRFNKRDTRRMLENSGFKVLYIVYMNSLLFLPIILKRNIDKVFNLPPKSDVKNHSDAVNTFLFWVLRVEKMLQKFLSFPFGISILVVAQKKC